MAAKRYPALIYRTAPHRQRMIATGGPHKGALIGCTDTSLAMAIMDTTQDGLVIDEETVRALSGEGRTDESPGLNMAQLDKVCGKLHVVFTDATGQTWSQLVAHSNENRRIVAQLWYADIGGSAIGHAVLVEAFRDKGALIIDPMKGQREWISPAKLRKGMETFGAKTGLAAGRLRFGYLRRCTMVAAGASTH